MKNNSKELFEKMKFEFKNFNLGKDDDGFSFFKRLKIRNKILFSVLSVNLILLLAIFILYFNFAESTINKETEDKAFNKVAEVREKLIGFLNSKAKIAWTFSEHPDLKEWLKTNEVRFVPDENPELKKLREYFQTLVDKDGDIKSGFVASQKNGMYYDNIGYSVDETYYATKRPWYQQTVEAGTGIYEVGIDYSTGEIGLNYRNPIYDDNNKLLGVGGIDFTLGYITNFLKNITVFETGQIFLMSNDGTILFHPTQGLTKDLNIKNYKDEDNKYKNVAAAATKVLNGVKGIEHVVFEGESRMFFQVPIEQFGWSLILSVTEDEINAPLDTIFNWSVIFFFISIIAIVLSIYLITNRITGPILRLKNEIKRTADKGDLYLNYNIESKDEFGELAKVFINMLQQIRNKAELAKEIAEGHLDVEINLISDEDVLGKTMAQMRDSIIALMEDINELSTAATNGNLSVRTHPDLHSGEFRTILEGINVTIDSILRPINETTQVLEKVANRDLTGRVVGDYKGDHAKLKETLNTAVQNLDLALQQVARTLDSHAHAADEISKLTDDIADGISQQSVKTAEVASAVEEMTTTISDTTQNANEMAQTAERAKSSANEGGSVVEKTISGMNLISDKVHQSASVVQTLGKSSEEIGEIISVINDIADQTNLLALNAAIEAARAGEQGRGFAVVADEVRKLAERTTKATKEIEGMIKKIQTDTQDAVTSMEAGTGEVENGIKLADAAGIALREIVEISALVTEKVNQIAAANEEQSNTSHQIAENVENINTVSQNSASGMEMISQHVENFKDLTDHLKQLNSMFKLSNTSMLDQNILNESSNNQDENKNGIPKIGGSILDHLGPEHFQ